MAGAVSYRCFCGISAPLDTLYWCRFCVGLRCGRCAQHEIDSYFSPDCLDEHMPTAEAKLNRNRCLKCPQCPLCPHALATVPLAAGEAGEAGEGQQFFLECAHCHWSSKAAGWTGTQTALAQRLEDANNGVGRGAEQMAALVEVCKRLAADEMRAMEVKRQTQGTGGGLLRNRSLQRYSTYHRTGVSLSHADCVVSSPLGSRRCLCVLLCLPVCVCVRVLRLMSYRPAPQRSLAFTACRATLAGTVQLPPQHEVRRRARGVGGYS